MFPIPFGEQLTVSLGSLYSADENAFARIFDLNGSMVAEQKVTGENITMKTPELPSGMYLLKISGISVNFVQKIVKG